ncbi:helix-turn-helix domain-containing protein [Streptomyces atratus]|uniref:helix-turn-helix domain-containing protein n=1 Tax=Streptomyces atratus TaxID=1893 RepID=UPI002AC3393A|nr:helix-turn-helix domain-containing protein [Streptomyces atratus]WPW29530.1 helix-turn-helix domain-containing protein [Streptomyces atratus]
MDTQQISAPSRAPSPVRGDATPSSGVVHINSRHTSHFTVVGNHLAQHRELSLLAIGLATHIQSLPAGTKVGIKPLTERFPDSEARIAAALRELEAHGYLKRTRERLPDGRVVTRTCSYNQPGSIDARPVPAPRRRPKRSHPAPVAAPAPALAPVATPAPPTPEAPAPAPTAVTPTPAPRPTSPATPKPPPLPRPTEPLPQLLDAAIALLTDLHRRAPHITLTERDIHHLAPAVATWFERGTTPAAVRQALTSDLPQPLRFPAKFLRHRLIALLPPPTTPAHQPAPLQNCDRCDRAFRSPTPGNCHDCAADEPHLLSA